MIFFTGVNHARKVIELKTINNRQWLKITRNNTVIELNPEGVVFCEIFL